jgi:uncharacterized protein
MTMTRLTDNQIQVADLVDKPGASREIGIDLVVPDDLGTAVMSVEGPATFEGLVESVVDGLIVRGRLSARRHLSCARCLTDVVDDVGLDVVEWFTEPDRAHAEDGEDEAEAGYEIVDGFLIDLDTLLRDALLPSAPYRPLCRSDCRGLCVTCGADRNLVDCGCTDTDADPRWAKLAELRLPDDGFPE